MKNILFYGDSNTWGFDPETGGRYPYHDRWTSVCAKLLGENYNCIPAGMNGRTTAFDDPVKGCRNGLEGLDYELQSHKPLDLCVIMLGTNDLKYTNAQGSAAGMKQLLEKVLSANERFSLSSPVFPEGAEVLLVSPVHITGNLGDGSGNPDPENKAKAESERLADLYKNLSSELGIHYLDAARITLPSTADGIHLDLSGHHAIGEAVAKWIRCRY